MEQEARNKLIEDNMKLVYHMIKKHYPWLWHDEDIIQAGMVGLILAADTWDESRSQFSTWAAYRIRNEIRAELKRRTGDDSVLSLDYEYERDDGGSETLKDSLVSNDSVELSTLTLYSGCLNEREKMTLEYVLKGGQLVDLAKELGVSKQFISKQYRLARLKIKKAIEDMNKED